MKFYDLRSDTVTLPSAEMRKAMHKADVGDDVFGEDPSINALEDLACKLTGKKAALFVPSGSMANLIALYLLCGRGREVLTQKNSHIIHFELSSAAAVAGVLPIGIEAPRGILTPDLVEPHLRPETYYMPKTGMIEIENTHNYEGGTVYTLEELKSIHDFARKKNLPLHMDGARLFNAAVALNQPVKKLCGYSDSVCFCISKGLGAPVGSLLCGSTAFIEEARRVRKMLGGGMRQAGMLAAAGIYALQNNVERLQEDHDNARTLGKALEESSWAEIKSTEIETNILYFRTPFHKAETVTAALKKRGVLCGSIGPDRIRMVTSLAVTPRDIEEICQIIRSLKP